MKLHLACLIAVLAGCAPVTPMIKATSDGQREAVQALIAQGEDVNKVGTLLGFKDKNYGTPLMQAASDGQTSLAIVLLEHGAKVNTRGGGVFSPLLLAAARGHQDMVELLLDSGADPKLKSIPPPFGGTPLFWAEKGGYSDAAKVLKAAEAGRLPGRFVRGPDGKIIDRKRSGAIASENAAALLAPHLAAIESLEKAGDAAREGGRSEEALAHYVAALREVPWGAGGTPKIRALRDKIVQYATSLDPPPPISEEARTHAVKAQAYAKMARNNTDYESALREFYEAFQLAPWWGDAYYNFALMNEKLGSYDGAIRGLNLYLMATPDAQDAAQIRSKIAELEVLQEHSRP